MLECDKICRAAVLVVQSAPHISFVFAVGGRNKFALLKDIQLKPHYHIPNIFVDSELEHGGQSDDA